jgi:hypothetical protein
MRGLLDKALENVEAILDKPFLQTVTNADGAQVTTGVAAGDKLRAAQFVWQTVRGKMPENVQVTIDSKPFERIFEGIARGITREQSREVRGRMIEAEIVEIPTQSEEPPKRPRRTCPDVPEVPSDGLASTQRDVQP